MIKGYYVAGASMIHNQLGAFAIISAFHLTEVFVEVFNALVSEIAAIADERETVFIQGVVVFIGACISERDAY